jgi:hypothetical protein
MMPEIYDENPDVNVAPESVDQDEDSGEPNYEEDD